MEHIHEARLQTVERSIEKIETSVAKIADSMELIARLEERHAITREALADVVTRVNTLDTRIMAVEVIMPMMKEVRVWMVSGVLSVVGALAFAMFQQFVHTRV